MRKFLIIYFALQSIAGFCQNKSLHDYITDTLVINGDTIIGITIPGSPPPDKLMPIATPSRSAVMLVNCPAFDWCYGCSATAGAMIAGYYDRNYHPEMYTGPANGGVVPLDNSIWGWGQCPLSATRMGYDGLTEKGHVDDFWVYSGSTAPDPYITGGWTPHAYEGCTADFMGTNQSALGNKDGATGFYFDSWGNPLVDFQAPPGSMDGCAGLRDFFESRGYNVNLNYSQLLPGVIGNPYGYTFDQYKTEIDNGRPVMIHLTGHSIVGVGYDNSNQTIYIHDTWDHDLHEMTWGGSYAAMTHESVSVFHIADILGGTPEISVNTESLEEFLEIDQTSNQTITISNTGTADLEYLIVFEENGNVPYNYRSVLLFRDQIAWGVDVNLPLLESYSSVEVTVAGSSEMSTIDLNSFDVIIMESDQPQEFYNQYINNFSRFEEYVAKGGVLQFHSATASEERIPNLPFPGGMENESEEELCFSNSATAHNPPHPITGEFVSIGMLGNYISHEGFNIYTQPLGKVPLVMNCSGNLSFLEYDYGAGTVLATGMTLEQANIMGWNYAGLLPNTMDYSLGISPKFFWLTATPLQGTLTPNTSVDIDFTFDTKGVARGFYEAGIFVLSNAPNRNKTEIPVTLKVAEGITRPENLTADLDQPTGMVELNWELSDYDGFYEDFEDDTAQNFIFSDDRFSVEDGNLQMYGINDETWANAYYDYEYGNFILEFEFTRQQSESTLSKTIGAFVRADGPLSYTEPCNGILISFTTSGYYSAWLLTDGVESNLLPWTTTEVINTELGAANYVTIMADGPGFDIFINGQYIDDFNWGWSSQTGFIGLCTYDSGTEPNEVWWDYVYVTTDFPSVWENIEVITALPGNPVSGGDISYCPGAPLSNAYNPAMGLLVPDLMDQSRDFLNFNVYRNGYVIGTTTDTNYTCNMPYAFEPVDFEVTAVFDQGESDPAGPVSVCWDSIPGISVYPLDFYVELEQNQTANEYTNIWNYGNADLTFSMQIEYLTEAGRGNLPDGAGSENSWLSVDPQSGTLAPDSSLDAELTIDASGLLSGYYDAEISVESNDPKYPVRVITVTLKVGNGLPPPYNLSAVPDQLTGQVDLSWEFDVPEGFYDNFEDGTADNWIPVTGNWSIDDQAYRVVSTIDHFSHSSYYNEDFSNFVYEAKMKITTGAFPSAGIAFRGDPANINETGGWTNGFSLGYTTNGYWFFGKRVNDEFTSLQGLTFSSDIISGLNEWNTIKVVVSGELIEVYFNGIYHGGFNDDSFTTGKVGLNMGDSEHVGTAYYDYVSLSAIANLNSPETKNITGSFASPDAVSGLNAETSGNREDHIFQYFNIYRDGSVIGNTNQLFYTDFLPYMFEMYAYEVTAVYDVGESDPAGPVEVYWEGAPVIAVFPEEFYQEVMPGELEITSLVIDNSGESDLSYTINIEEKSQGINTTWLSVSPMEGFLPGLAWYFNSHKVTFDAESLSLGQYEADILISSNDPQNPTVTIPVTLLVTNSPVLHADFDANPRNGYSPLTVQFTDLSIGEDISWYWEFDQQGLLTSYEQNPVFIYYEPGIYSVKLQVSTPQGNSDREMKKDFIIVSDFQHTINLNEGWMGISSYLLPLNSGIETILSPIEGDYEIIHDLNDFYQPGNQGGGLNDWDRKSGYFIKLNKQTQLPIYGNLTLDTDINFYEGWNLIPVLFDTEVDLPSYFGSHIDKVIIVRDAIGLEVYWPENNIATLENLRPGRSYLVKVSEDFALSCSPQPTQAWAGTDQIDVPGTQTTLEGNIPEIGEGYWSIVSGNGGNISEPTNPTSVFSGVVSEPYVLEWRISNACGATADIVQISFQESTATYILTTISEPPDGGTTTGDGFYPEGEPVTVTATAAENFTFINWTDENDIQISTEPAFEYTMPDEDVTLTANFEEEQSGFTCGEPFTDDRDGQSYETLQIGDQCWMSQNLAYLPEVSPSSQGSNIYPYYYVYNYQGTSVAEAKATTNHQIYGVLYNWTASVDACPEGWNLPTDAEWAILDNYVSSQPEYLCNGNTDNIAKALAATTNWNSSSNTCAVGNNLSANDATGFSGLPGGCRNAIGNFFVIGDAGYWWSSTEFSTTTAWYWGLNYYSANITRSIPYKNFGMSVRCWQDVTNPPTTYNLILEVEPAEAGTVQGSGQYEAGDIITVSANANSGWDFVNWTDENDIQISTEPAFEYTMPDEDVTLTANFDEEQTGFTCGDPFTDPRDGQSYETVLIGEQCWMAENLNIGEQIDGGGSMSNNGTIEKYCYDNLSSNCATYGGLYQWDEMMDYSITPGSQGICPEGWHVPTDDEWKILEGTVDSMYPVGDPIWDNIGPRGFDAGKNLKSTTLWNNNGIGSDLYNFTALPSGHMWAANGFILLGEVGFYFTSSKDVDIVIDRTLGTGSDQVYRWNSGTVNEARSVRCLKD